MHIPDGFLSAEVWIPAAIVSTGALAFSIRKSNKLLQDKSIPRIGIISAFIFAAQMINFPVSGGSSGHLLGASLAVALLGPWLASVSLSLVLIIQCFLFQDGGVTALGANIFNMAFVGVFSAYFIQKLFTKNSKLSLVGQIEDAQRRTFLSVSSAGILISSWFSIVIASFVCSLELGFSNLAPLNIVLPAMLITHSIIGIGEAIITLPVYLAVRKVIPDFDGNETIKDKS